MWVLAPSVRTLPSLWFGLCGAALMGCAVENDFESALEDSHVPAAPPEIEDEPTKTARGWDGVETEGLIVGPDEVTVAVGDDLRFDVAVRTPESGNLVPSVVPDTATLDGTADLVHLTWMPGLEDRGDHLLLFLVVDEWNPDLVIAQKTILVEVVTRLDLVEYGF